MPISMTYNKLLTEKFLSHDRYYNNFTISFAAVDKTMNMEHSGTSRNME